jgi:hypothetical protein
MSDDSRLKRMVESLRWRRNALLARCAKACFMGEDGKTPTEEGERILAEIRKHANLFVSGIKRDRNGSIDKDELIRIEGRREIALWLFNLLELDPREVARFVEVDNGKE